MSGSQWVTMAADLFFLQPVNGSIVSYAMRGKSYDAPIPERRTKANTPRNTSWRGLYTVMVDSCMGLMSNHSAIDMLKVFDCLLRPCFDAGGSHLTQP